MMNKNVKKIILPALATILVIGLMVGPVIAYFTDHTESTGAVKVKLGSVTTLIEEPPTQNIKIISVKNEGPESCYVRVKAIPDTLQPATGDDWTKSGGFYYYIGNGGELAANQKTGTLQFLVDGLVGGAEGDSFDVTIVYETIRVQYDAAGSLKSPIPDPDNPGASADWSLELITATTQGGGN